MNPLIPLFFLPVCGALASAVVSVDIEGGLSGSESVRDGWHRWAVSPGLMASRSVEQVKVTLKPGASSAAELRLFSVEQLAEGVDAVAGDGVYVAGGSGAACLEFHIEGLAPGLHHFRSYHNSPWKEATGPYRVFVQGRPESAVEVAPSRWPAVDSEAATACLEFSVGANADPVVILVESADVNVLGRVVVNGFEVGRSDPSPVPESH